MKQPAKWNKNYTSNSTPLLWNQIQEADICGDLPKDHTPASNPGAEERGLLPTQVHKLTVEYSAWGEYRWATSLPYPSELLWLEEDSFNA